MERWGFCFFVIVLTASVRKMRPYGSVGGELSACHHQSEAVSEIGESMAQSLAIESCRGQKLAELLHRTFSTSGIFGDTEMPEDQFPTGVQRGSLEHILFITFTVAIDYQRDANALSDISRVSFGDPETHYLYHPESLHLNPPSKIISDVQKHGLSKKQKKDAHIWRTIGVTFHKKWNGNPLNFLEDCGWDSLVILERLRNDSHLYNGKSVPDYPYLRGNKIGPLWLRMLRDNVGISKLGNLEKIPIPVDIHIARASLTTGVVRGKYEGKLEDLFKSIREAWFLSVQGLRIKERPMIALDVDEPLWHLSKYGCTNRNKLTGQCAVHEECDVKDFCVKGKILIEGGLVELDT